MIPDAETPAREHSIQNLELRILMEKMRSEEKKRDQEERQRAKTAATIASRLQGCKIGHFGIMGYSKDGVHKHYQHKTIPLCSTTDIISVMDTEGRIPHILVNYKPLD